MQLRSSQEDLAVAPPSSPGGGCELEVPAPLFCKLCTQNEPPFKAVLMLRNYLRGNVDSTFFKTPMTLSGLNVVFWGVRGGDRCTTGRRLALMWAPNPHI